MSSKWQDTIEGKVWVFPDNVDTDVITSGKYLNDLNAMLNHILAPLNSEFPKKVQKGDIIVAGENFGCGSSRETAPEILQMKGIAAIIAGSFARIFYRNSISIGLPIFEIKGIKDNFSTGDVAKINLLTAEIENITQNKAFHAEKFPPLLLDILKAGGELKLLYAEVKEKKKALKAAGKL
ncbi:MAG: 3-isopropylmalate dehydratase [Candidatus Helarchaeota archaeon]|nr:3-isopropylmalate dehydratase [Candidatus Helarchaeota archaeon]